MITGLESNQLPCLFKEILNPIIISIAYILWYQTDWKIIANKCHWLGFIFLISKQNHYSLLSHPLVSSLIQTVRKVEGQFSIHTVLQKQSTRESWLLLHLYDCTFIISSYVWLIYISLNFSGYRCSYCIFFKEKYLGLSKTACTRGQSTFKIFIINPI